MCTIICIFSGFSEILKIQKTQCMSQECIYFMMPGFTKIPPSPLLTKPLRRLQNLIQLGQTCPTKGSKCRPGSSKLH